MRMRLIAVDTLKYVLGGDGRPLVPVNGVDKCLPRHRVEVRDRRPSFHCRGAQCARRAFGRRECGHMTPMDYIEKVAAMVPLTVVPSREVHTVYFGAPIIVDHQNVEGITRQARDRKGTDGANVLIVVAGKEIVSKLPHLSFGLREHLLRTGRRGELILHLRGESPDLPPKLSSKLMNLRRVRGISRRDIPWGSQENRGCKVEQEALMQFVLPGA